MKRRCDNHSSYKNIRVCDRWSDSFMAFYEDMGKKPTPSHTIERTDNDGDYEPENCKWATRREQAANRGLYSNNTSGFKGVYKKRKRWMASVGINRVNYTFLTHETKEEAAAVYDQVILQLYGDDVYLNFDW